MTPTDRADSILLAVLSRDTRIAGIVSNRPQLKTGHATHLMLSFDCLEFRCIVSVAISLTTLATKTDAEAALHIHGGLLLKAFELTELSDPTRLH